MSPPVGIVGAGGFGKGLAIAASRAGRDVLLWSRGKPGVDAARVTTTRKLADLGRAELVLVAAPSQHVASIARELGASLDGSHFVVHVSRGLVGDELGTLTRVLRTETPARRVGALAGPISADALARGEPGGGIVGSQFPEVVEAVREAISGATLRLYHTDDVVGVEVASAMVGLIALTAGFGKGIGLGPATLAILATRGLAEAARVGRALGGEDRTFHGLAGVGDLCAAIAGDGRPELRLGQALAKGKSLEDAGAEAGAYIEGVSIARRVAAYADRVGIEAPIAQAVARMLDGELSPKDAIEKLMTRRSGAE